MGYFSKTIQYMAEIKLEPKNLSFRAALKKTNDLMASAVLYIAIYCELFVLYYVYVCVYVWMYRCLVLPLILKLILSLIRGNV